MENKLESKKVQVLFAGFVTVTAAGWLCYAGYRLFTTANQSGSLSYFGTECVMFIIATIYSYLDIFLPAWRSYRQE